MGYTKDTAKGLTWMSLFRVVSRFGAFVRIALLARLLTPSQFGIFGIASFFLSFLETITQTGVNVYLVQERKNLDEYVSTAWIVSIFRGLAVSFILFTLSMPVSQFFNSPESENLIRLISLVALIRGFINPSRVKLLKELEFKHEFWFSFWIFLFDSVVTVIISFLLMSPAGLVWGLIAGAILEVILSFILIKPRPGFSLEVEKVKDILRKGKWVTGAGVFDYLFEQGDDMAVGKLLNTSSLGIYQQAYKLSTLPLTEVTRVFNQVTFPVYSNISNDFGRLKRAFLRTTLAILLMVVPIGIMLYLFSREVVLVILGENWISAVPVLKVLALFGIIRAFLVSTNPLFNSVKKQKYVTLITIVGFFVMAVTVIPFVLRWGVIGAGYSVLAGSISAIPVFFILLSKVFKSTSDMD